MSRTKKDRPYWVKLNSDGVKTHHDHLVFGKEVKRRVYVLDKQGNHVTEMKTSSVRIFNYARWDSDVWKAELYGGKEAVKLLNDGSERYYTYVEREYVGYKTELVTDFVYEDHCTEGQKISKTARKWWRNGLPCTPELTAEHKRFRQGQAYKDDRKLFNGGVRAGVRDELKNITKEFNGGEDVSYREASTEQHRRSISWWY